MDQQRSIVEEIRRGPYEASVIATFNAYFPFYEEVILPHLQNSGCRQNAVMLDSNVCGGMLKVESLRPRLAGRQYSLLPISCNGSFHPKLLLLLGKKKGLLLVGSHNLTLAGFSHNRELTNRFEFSLADSDSLPAFQSAWQFIENWSTRTPVPLQRTIEQIGAAAPWLFRDVGATGPSPLLTALPDGPSLWEKLQQHLPRNAKRITVVGPFFDADFSFLDQLRSSFPKSEFLVGIDPETVVLRESARKGLHKVRFVLTEHLGNAKGYLHAKALLIETEDGNEIFVSGSANPSQPAWMNGNAEVVVVSKVQARKSLAKALGFRDLLKAPLVSEDSWRAISERPITEWEAETGQAAASAFETDNGIQIYLSAAKTKIKPEARLIASNNSVLDTVAIEFGNQGALHLNVPDKALRTNVALLDMETESGSRLSAMVHHPWELAVHAQSNKERDLRTALDSLETDTPLIDELMKVVERAIFEDEFSVSTPTGKLQTKEKEQAATEKVQANFSIRLAEIRTPKTTVQRLLSSGTLGALLDALIHQLGIGLEAGIAQAPMIARSEEELIDSEDEKLVNIAVVDSSRLVALCQRKIKTIFRRMIRQLENASTSDSLATRTMVQLAAVLGIVQRLCRVTSEEVTWIPRGETLVPFDARNAFFIEATRLVYSTEGVMKKAIAQLQNRAVEEISLVKGLLIWLAWDLDYHVENPVDFEDADDVADNIEGLSRLLPLAIDLHGDEEAIEKARSAIESSAHEYDPSEYDPNWLAKFLTWSNDIYRLQWAKPNTNNRTGPQPGDIVLAGKPPRLFTVAEAFHGKVKLIDLDVADELRTFSSEYVTVLKSAY